MGRQQNCADGPYTSSSVYLVLGYLAWLLHCSPTLPDIGHVQVNFPGLDARCDLGEGVVTRADDHEVDTLVHDNQVALRVDAQFALFDPDAAGGIVAAVKVGEVEQRTLFWGRASCDAAQEDSAHGVAHVEDQLVEPVDLDVVAAREPQVVGAVVAGDAIRTAAPNHGVVAVATFEAVVTIAAGDVVVAEAAVYLVVAAAPAVVGKDIIVAGPATNGVVTDATKDRVAAGPAVDQVVAGTDDHIVAAAATVDGVVAVVAVDLVAAAATVEPICSAVAVQVVVTSVSVKCIVAVVTDD